MPKALIEARYKVEQRVFSRPNRRYGNVTAVHRSIDKKHIYYWVSFREPDAGVLYCEADLATEEEVAGWVLTV